MEKKYNLQENEQQMVSEPVTTYGYAVTSQPTNYNVAIEPSNSEKKEFLRSHLHSSTAEFLESVDWMENKPFPMYSDSDDDEAWIDAAEAEGNADVIDNAIVIKDRLAWQNLR